MFHCIGCGRKIAWDGHSPFSYTCACGSHIFVSDETGHYSWPGSFLLALRDKRELAHLDYLVGNSEYTSPEKEGCIAALRDYGSIWMRECEQCREDGTLARHELDLKFDRLRGEVRRRRDLGELSQEEAMEDLVALYDQHEQELLALKASRRE